MNTRTESKTTLRFSLYLFQCLMVSFFPLLIDIHPLRADEYPLKSLQRFIGTNDAVIIADPRGKILFEKNSDQKLIPASTLKILTSLVALHYLGPNYKFPTEFYYDEHQNLWIKGYGDPLLISEVLADIAAILSKAIDRLDDIFLDDSFFLHPIIIPGITPSSKPYDAPNGALCANFNTVYFKRNKSGNYTSAEPQTPLLSFVIPRIKASPHGQERIILSNKNRETTLYTGHLLKFFLNNYGVKTTGNIKIGNISKKMGRLILRYYSSFSLAQVIVKLMKYSNNFIANQILITTGAILYNPPGTLDKGIRAVKAYLKTELGIEDISFVEGSGISKKNRISAQKMLKILEKFEPYYFLMRNEKAEYYKTGSLYGVSTRAGFLQNKKGELYRFVVFINTPGKSSEPLMKKIRSSIPYLSD